MNVIYKIRNVINAKFYVGSTVDSHTRFQTHRRRLRKGNHHCAHLQAAWNKYGEDCFKFEIVEEVPETENLQAAEERWLAEHHGEKYCYNTGKSADAPWRGVYGALHPSFGCTVSEDNKAAISATLKAYYAADPANHPRRGTTHTEEAKAKMAKKYVHRGETHYRYGKQVSPEVRAKIGDTQRGVKKAPGRVISEEGKVKIMAAVAEGRYSHQKGKPKSAEMRQKISKPIVEKTTGKEFPSLSAALEFYEMTMPTLQRALKTRKPIDKRSEKFAGLTFEYVTFTPPEK